MKSAQLAGDAVEVESFEVVTQEEFLSLWRTFRGDGLSAQEAWRVIVTGMVLDMALERSEALRRVLQ